MRIDCPRCRRLLEYSGERPSFCAYCGSALDLTGDEATEAGSSARPAGPDLEATRKFPEPSETVAYSSSDTAEAARLDHEDFPERIAGYRLIRRLGTGGMGTVFEAEDETQGQRVAVKLIGGGYLSSSEAVQRFRQEGKLASAVTHPRCVFVLAVDEAQGRPYIVMELMPGTTLQSLVEQQGPLDPAGAIVKMLDVIEGLQEFHKLGMIHRDVKPSNCFLERDGRVKIGDFGLSKSLDGGLDLTRTGAFIGTPLYASPEQIKRDQVDERTDVYSVAATLYFLLTGRPPVQAKDAAEALARIVSEPAPAIRTFRRDVPRALEAVILRGLERDRSRRWRDLQEFHDALLPFVPDRLTFGGIGLRVVAFALDVGLFYLGSWALFGLGMVYHDFNFFETYRFFELNGSRFGWAERAIWVAYLAVLEGLAGATLGKYATGLRVTRVGRGGPPGLVPATVRAVIFYLLTETASDLLDAFSTPQASPRMALNYLVYLALFRGMGILALVSTMRQRSGFRGLHEWLSGTRVVQVKRIRRPRPFRLRGRQVNSTPPHHLGGRIEELVPRVGPYVIRGAVKWDQGRKILLGQDSTLERPVWIVFRPTRSAPPDATRRGLSRLARPRWIGGGDQPDARWDAFTAPAGYPLTQLAEGDGLPWRDALPILHELAEELQAAHDDGTLPDRLCVEQVWVQPDGRVQLVDPIEAGGDPESSPAPEGSGGGPDGSGGSGLPDPGNGREGRALAFMGEVARLALEGRREPKRGLTAALFQPARSGFSSGSSDGGKSRTSSGLVRYRRIQAAVPERSRVILEKLSGLRPPYPNLLALKADLDDAASRPTEVTAFRRGVQLAIQGFFLSPGLIAITSLSCCLVRPRAFPWDLETLFAVPLLWVLWAILSRGGLSFPLAGIAIVRKNGRRAGGLICGWRAFQVWAPVTALLASSRVIQHINPVETNLAWGLWIGGIALLLSYVAIALIFPSRGPHDRLSGTVLVPI